MLVIKLSELNGTNGFRVEGIAASDQAGESVSAAGDINGDGIDDFIIGASENPSYGAIGTGEAYVVFGTTAGFSASFDLSSLDGSNGFRIDGWSLGDDFGYSVAGAGDVNGDGIDDVIVGARNADPAGRIDAGSSYVIFGSTGGFSASIDVSSLNGNDGFRIGGLDAGDEFGQSVASAGDVNGDGIDDVIIGADRAEPNGFASGESYVVFGSSAGFGASFDPASLDGTNGFVFEGGLNSGFPSNVGQSVSGGGDINGDGIDDVIIGAPGLYNGAGYAGGAYVIFGSTAGFSSTLDPTDLDGTNGFQLTSVGSQGIAGWSVSMLGDVNGDGIDDLIIGAPFNNTGSGRAFVVFGSTGGFSSNLSLSSLDGTNGFLLREVETMGNAGDSVGNAGDVNGDGIDDLIIGVQYSDDERFGSYVLFGSSDGFASTIILSTIDAQSGFRIDGVEFHSVSGAGDINGDGFDDLIVGNPFLEPNGTRSGESYVVFGFDPNAPTAGNDTLMGTPGGDTIDGLGGADLIQGLDGADSLLGSGGNDTLEGGDGKDTLLGGGGNDTLVGGIGNDLLRGQNGRDVLRGEAGADTLEGRNGKDFLEGGAGADSLIGGAGEDTAIYESSASAVTVNLTTGTGSGGHAQGDSLSLIENLIGSSQSDSMIGDGGINRIQGGNGNDTLEGGGGNDRLFGDNGGDSMSGGAGNDTLIGGTGGDSMEGGGGADSLSGSDGSDTLKGGNAADSLSGGTGDDELFGDNGNDILRGNGNRDLLDGGSGSDTLIGGNGSDTLRGGTGTDLLDGSGGPDEYLFLDGDGMDTISFFQDGLDILDLSQHANVTGFGDITETQQGADLLVAFDNNDSVLIENFLEADLTEADFFFGA